MIMMSQIDSTHSPKDYGSSLKKTWKVYDSFLGKHPDNHDEVMSATESGVSEKLLVALQARSLRKYVNGNVTPLMLAATMGNLECVQVLIGRVDADVMGRGTGLLSERERLFFFGSPMEMGEWLRFRIETSLSNTIGANALMEAAAGGHQDCVELLLPVTNLRAITVVGGKTAATIARERGHEDIAVLIEKRAAENEASELRAHVAESGACNSAPPKRSRSL